MNKSRIWNSLEKYYYIQDHYDILAVDSRTGKPIFFIGDEEGRYEIFNGNESVKIEPCSGREDCNGKSIYHGDIIQQRFGGGVKGAVLTVEYSEEVCSWTAKVSGSRLVHLLKDINTAKCEIIGNIHDKEA